MTTPGSGMGVGWGIGEGDVGSGIGEAVSVQESVMDSAPAALVPILSVPDETAESLLHRSRISGPPPQGT
jgi:ribosomal protein S5